MSQQRSYQLGIDLGTTYTAAAVAGDGATHPLQLTPDSHSMPSVVALREDGSMLAGEAAMRRALTEPTRVGREFKRRFGDAAPIVLGGTRASAEALTTALLREVLARATQAEGGAPTRVTLTHPAAWGPFRLEKLRAVAAEAGIEQVDLLPEPVAAAIANAGRVEAGSLVMVYDLGGGTFDAAVVRIGDNVIVGNPDGVERLGGIDVDALVMAHVDDATGGMVAEADIADADVRAGLARLVDDCRMAKEALSADAETEVSVSLPNVRTSVRITRAELEAMVRPRLDDSLAALDRTVASAGVTWNDIAHVLLVGGSSRIPLVAQVVREHTGRPVVTATNPHLAIALGAAAHAAAAERATHTPPSPAQPSAPNATQRTKRTPLLIGAGLAVAALVVGAVFAFGAGDDSTAPASTAGTTAPTTSTVASTAVATSGVTTATATTPLSVPQAVSVPVGDATLTATACTDTTGLLARSTATDIDGGSVAVIVDGNLYVLSVDSDCVITQAVDEVSGLLRDGDNDFTSVTILDDLLIVGSSGGGLVVDLGSGSDTECDLLREVVNRTPEGTIATYDIGGKGYDEIEVTAQGCTMIEAAKFSEFSFYAVASGPNAIFLGAAEATTPAVYAFLRSGKALWTYEDGSLKSIDGMSTCGDYLCLLDATSAALILLVPGRGQVVGTIGTADLVAGTPQRLNSAGDGYLTVGEPGVSTVLVRLTAE